MIDLRLGDCLEILPTLGKVDAIVSDPPYGINAVTRGRCFGSDNACRRNVYVPIKGDDRPFDPAHLLGLAPVVLLWGANHYADKLPASPSWFVWDKRDGCNSNPLADCEMAWSNVGGPARLFHHRWMGMIRASERGRRVHPTQKPVALMHWCIERLKLKPGATILDPYMGSGTTGVAAVELGYNFIGIESHEPYYRTAQRRLHPAHAAA